MINVTALYGGLETTGDPLRYGHRRSPDHGSPHPTETQPHDVPPSACERRPVVVWTMSRRCNLHCVHCYSDSANQAYAGELGPEEIRPMLVSSGRNLFNVEPVGARGVVSEKPGGAQSD